jgi:hypothetical protein
MSHKRNGSTFLMSLVALSVLGTTALAEPILVEPQVGEPLELTLVTVNDGPGNQTDPHVSGDLAAYTSTVTGSTQIRYYNFLTSTDIGIPNVHPSGVQTTDYLSDISGHTIVFT